MPEAFTVGPVLISTRVAAFVVAYLAARWLASRLAARWGLDADWTRNTADGAVLAGLVAARLGYAALYWEAYAAAPWTVLYFWQPGYLAVAGLAGGAFCVLVRLRFRRAQHRLSYLRAVSTGFAAGATILVAAIGSMGWFSGAGMPGIGDQAPDSPGVDPGGQRYALFNIGLPGGTTVSVGDEAPDFQLLSLEGRRVALSDLRGEGVVLNFWATWCPPCRREMPLLESAWQEYRSKGVVIVGVDVGESQDTVRPFVGSMGLSYPIWTNAEPGSGEFDDTNDLLNRFGGVGLPTTVFIDADGVIRKVYIGELSRGLLAKWLPKLVPG